MTSAEIDEMLHDAHIGRLSMADAQGKPYTIPLPFCWANETVYLRLPLTGRKGQILAHNNFVCFEIDRFTPSFDQYESVLVEGRLVEVIDLAEKARVKQLNDEKYNRLRNGHRPGHGRTSDLTALPMRKIQIESVSGRKKDPQPTATLAICSAGSGEE